MFLVVMIEFVRKSLVVEFCNFSQTLLKGGYDAGNYKTNQFLAMDQYLDIDMMLDIEGEGSRRVPAGSAIILPPGVSYKIVNPTSKPVRCFWHMLSFSIMGGIDPFRLLTLKRFVFPSRAGKKVSSINCELIRNKEERDKNFLKYIVRQNALALELFSIAISFADLKTDGLDVYHRVTRLSPALDYIHSNIHKNINLKKLSNILAVSEIRTYELFKEAFGISPLQYVLHRKMLEAQKLLIEEKRIYEIAEQVGFKDPYNFSHAFKKHCGMSPKKFREQILPS